MCRDIQKKADKDYNELSKAYDELENSICDEEQKQVYILQLQKLCDIIEQQEDDKKNVAKSLKELQVSGIEQFSYQVDMINYLAEMLTIIEEKVAKK